MSEVEFIARYYLDTSAAVKLIVPESDSKLLQEYFRNHHIYYRVKFEKLDLIYYFDIRLWFSNVHNVKVENFGNYQMVV